MAWAALMLESPEHNRVALPDPAIRDQSAEQGREVH